MFSDSISIVNDNNDLYNLFIGYNAPFKEQFYKLSNSTDLRLELYELYHNEINAQSKYLGGSKLFPDS